MAAFLARTGGRAEGAIVSNTMVPDAPDAVVLGSVSLKAGDVQGGTANVKIDASFVGLTETADGCPCTALVFLADDLGPLTLSFVTLGANVFEGSAVETGSITFVVPVETGVSRTYELVGGVLGGTEEISLAGDMTATYFPFAGDGTNPSSLSSARMPADERGFPVFEMP
jgi:hypothetical protein